jgi:uncharacterized protein (TIGR02145 family)
MKKFLFVVSVFLIAFSILAQQVPLMKIYMDDGSTKQYNLKDIDSLGIIDNKNFYDMKIHYQDSLIAYYPTEIIGSIKFENDTNNNQVMNVYLFGYPKTYVLNSIDSIIFYKDIYQPLTIGSQVWMLKNLNVDHYRNGDSIPEVRNGIEWAKLTTGAWCYYHNEPDSGKIYDKLYNWYTVNDQRGLTPLGWHVPNDAEWKTLEVYLGMSQSDADGIDWRGINEGGKLKETGLSHWQSSNTGATNEIGFSAIPGGYRVFDGTFYAIGQYSFMWCITEDYSTNIWYRYLGFRNANIYRYYGCKENGYSVRCVRDN